MSKPLILDKITNVIYKGSYLNDKDLESFFNKRKRGMTFIIENKYIKKIIQRNYGKIEIFFNNEEKKIISGKILTLEKAEGVYYIGIDIDNIENIKEVGFVNREIVEASIFLSRLYQNEVIFPDLKVLLNNNDNYVQIPFYNEEDELVCYKIMTRKEALGIKKKELLI